MKHSSYSICKSEYKREKNTNKTRLISHPLRRGAFMLRIKFKYSYSFCIFREVLPYAITFRRRSFFNCTFLLQIRSVVARCRWGRLFPYLGNFIKVSFMMEHIRIRELLKKGAKIVKK